MPVPVAEDELVSDQGRVRRADNANDVALGKAGKRVIGLILEHVATMAKTSRTMTRGSFCYDVGIKFVININ